MNRAVNDNTKLTDAAFARLSGYFDEILGGLNNIQDKIIGTTLALPRLNQDVPTAQDGIFAGAIKALDAISRELDAKTYEAVENVYADLVKDLIDAGALTPELTAIERDRLEKYSEHKRTPDPAQEAWTWGWGNEPGV